MTPPQPRGGPRGRPGGRGPKGGGGRGGPRGGPGGKPFGGPPKRGPRYQPTILPRTWRAAYGVLTENAVPGVRIYGEKLFTHKGKELRTWNPRRSKLAALLMTGNESVSLDGTETVLYLGAASGTTVSHLADILNQGKVLAVEKSPRSFRDLIDVARARSNVLPLLADAQDTDRFVPLVAGGAHVVYQDIAQRDQARIFAAACQRFLRPQGMGILMVKARSIDIASSPEAIYDRVEDQLRSAGFKTVARQTLDPWERDHAALVVTRA